MTTRARAMFILSWLLLALAVYLLRYKMALTSDSLFYDDLAADLFVLGGRWQDWKLSGAPGFVADMLVYFLAYPVFPDAATRMHVVSAAQAVGLAAVSLYTARTLAPALRPAAQCLIVLLVAFATLVTAKSGMWLYFHTTNNHVSTLLFALLLSSLLLRHLAAPSRKLLAIVAISAALAGASSGLFLLSFTAPVLLLCGAAWLRYPQWRARIGAAMVELAAGQLVAWLLTRALVFYPAIEARPPLTWQTIEAAAKMFVTASVAAFTPDNKATFVFALFVAACFAYLALRLPRLARQDWKLAAAGALLAVAVPVHMAGVILSANAVDLATYRYFMFPIALACILAVVCLDRLDGESAPRTWSVAAALALVLALVGVQHARKAVRPVDEAAQVASCLAGLERGGLKLGAGIGDYWYARAVSYYLPHHNPILPTLHILRPFFWVSSIGPLKSPERYAPRHYNFAILRDVRDPGQFWYTEASIGTLLPPPTSRHACPGNKQHIWYYADNALDTRVKAEIAYFLKTGMTQLPP